MSLLLELQSTLERNVVPKLLMLEDLENLTHKELFFKSSNVLLFDRNLNDVDDLNYYFYLGKDTSYFYGLYGLNNIIFNNILFCATSFHKKDLETKTSDVFGFEPLFIDKLDKESHIKLKKDLFESINSYVDITENSIENLFDCLYLKNSSSILDTLFFYHDRNDCTAMCVENPKPILDTGKQETLLKSDSGSSVEGTCELINNWCKKINVREEVKSKIFKIVEHLIVKLNCFVKLEISLIHQDQIRLVIFPAAYKSPIDHLVDFLVEKGFIKDNEIANQLKIWCGTKQLEHDNFEYGFNHFTIIYNKEGKHEARVVYGVCDLKDGSRPYDTVDEKFNRPEYKEPIINL